MATNAVTDPGSTSVWHKDTSIEEEAVKSPLLIEGASLRALPCPCNRVHAKVAKATALATPPFPVQARSITIAIERS